MQRTCWQRVISYLASKKIAYNSPTKKNNLAKVLNRYTAKEDVQIETKLRITCATSYHWEIVNQDGNVILQGASQSSPNAKYWRHEVLVRMRSVPSATPC